MFLLLLLLLLLPLLLLVLVVVSNYWWFNTDCTTQMRGVCEQPASTAVECIPGYMKWGSDCATMPQRSLTYSDR